MPRHSKIDKRKLPGLVKEGKTQQQIADMFGVTNAAVSIAVKGLKIATGKAVTLEVGHKVVVKSLDTIEQLFNINQATKKILAELTEEDHIIDNMVKAVKAVIDYEAEPSKDRETYLKAIIKRIIGEKNTAIKACDTILKQLDFQHDIYKTMYDLVEIAEFQKTVIEAIGDVAPAVRKTIINNLKRKKALRESVTFPELRRDL